jgi:DNA-binding GntR family transcriptional regulator
MHTNGSHSQQVYHRLRDRIATGDLRPGDVMSEASLAKEFGLSRTPIGEALRQLAHEGVVHQVPRFGTIVRDVPARELAELFEIREVLEGMAASKAALTITAEAIGELHSLCATIDAEIDRNAKCGNRICDREGLRRFLAADMAFHMLVIASAGNERLCRMIEQNRSVSAMFAARRGEHPMQRVESANQAHKAIVAALEQRDSFESQRLVVEHIRRSRDQSLAQHVSAPATASLGSINLPEYVRRELVSP